MDNANAKAGLSLIGYKAVSTRVIEVTDVSANRDSYLSGDESFPASQVLPLLQLHTAIEGRDFVVCPYCHEIHRHDPVERQQRMRRKADCLLGDYMIELSDELDNALERVEEASRSRAMAETLASFTNGPRQEGPPLGGKDYATNEAKTRKKSLPQRSQGGKGERAA